MPNYNEKTGIPYGVLNGNSVLEFLDDIQSNGDNLTFEYARTELKEKIGAAIASVFEDYVYQKPEDFVKDAIDLDEILSALEDRGLWDYYEEDEPEYDYEYDSDNGPVKVHVGWLGGASPLIWVLESPYVAYCRQCSPCVPGAGDLDSPTELGMMAYCLPEEDMPEDWKGSVLLLADIQKDANL